MQTLLKTIRQWISETFREPYRAQIEDYLAESVDQADLERRIRIIQHRGML
jgi:hypothetical protein